MDGSDFMFIYSNTRMSNYIFHRERKETQAPRSALLCRRKMSRARVFALICLLMMQTVLSIRPEGIEFKLDTSSKLEKNILQESIVNLINGNSKAGWKASLNTRFANHTVSQFKDLLGVKPLPEGGLENLPLVSHNKVMALPKYFDAREVWSQCSTISRILDQGHCGACWAFGAVEVLSDRFCIHFGQNVSLSPNDLLSCCEFCGDGCNGGYPSRAWNYFVSNGVVTEQCDPYFDTEGCSHPGCSPVYPTPACAKQCAPASNLVWRNSKHFAVNAYKVGPDERAIMAEIYRNGPVEVAFTVYEDFAHYESGVYRHVTGEEMGGHAVKLMGWGISEEGEKYWILANQWNRSWGENGYFKMLRGVNECGIEEEAVAGLPSPINTGADIIGVQTS